MLSWTAGWFSTKKNVKKRDCKIFKWFKFYCKVVISWQWEPNLNTCQNRALFCKIINPRNYITAGNKFLQNISVLLIWDNGDSGHQLHWRHDEIISIFWNLQLCCYINRYQVIESCHTFKWPAQCVPLYRWHRNKSFLLPPFYPPPSSVYPPSLSHRFTETLTEPPTKSE